MAGPATEGWLPPQAPGGRPPPRFDMVTPEPRTETEHAAVVAPPELAPPSAGQRPPVAARAETAPPQTNGLALTAVILGAIGIGLTLITAGLGFLFSLPCSVGAWVCGAQARTRYDLGETSTGRGQAQAGYILGVLGVVIGVVAAVGWIVWVANGGDLEQLQRDIERWRDEQTRAAAVHTVRALLGR
jgi:hypothetical protein